MASEVRTPTPRNLASKNAKAIPAPVALDSMHKLNIVMWATVPGTRARKWMDYAVQNFQPTSIKKNVFTKVHLDVFGILAEYDGQLSLPWTDAHVDRFLATVGGIGELTDLEDDTDDLRYVFDCADEGELDIDCLPAKGRDRIHLFWTSKEVWPMLVEQSKAIKAITDAKRAKKLADQAAKASRASEYDIKQAIELLHGNGYSVAKGDVVKAAAKKPLTNAWNANGNHKSRR